MSLKRNLVATGALLCLVVPGTTVAGAAPALSQSSAAQPWMNTHLAASQRVGLLLKAMTLDDEIQMVHGIGLPLPGAGAGSVAGNARLGIPALALSDGAVGVGNGATGVTQWPDAADQAATWNPALIQSYGSALGAEFAGKGRNIVLGPTVNILRVPNWGRAFETFSEDPTLSSALGVADIKGI